MGGLLGQRDQAPPPPAQPMVDNSAQMQAAVAGMQESMYGYMAQMRNMLQNNQANQTALISSMMSSMPSAPEIEREPEIDWAEEQERLYRQSLADYNLDSARRKGRADTILTSPLLDEEEESGVMGSVLSGS